jgi:hypothetical protein
LKKLREKFACQNCGERLGDAPTKKRDELSSPVGAGAALHEAFGLEKCDLLPFMLALCHAYEARGDASRSKGLEWSELYEVTIQTLEGFKRERGYQL